MRKTTIVCAAVIAFFWTTGAWAVDVSMDAMGPGYNSVNGNTEKFRENAQRVDGLVGGLEKISLGGESGSLKYDLEGRALFERDMSVGFNIKGKEGKSYFKSKFVTDRHYYDSSLPFFYSGQNNYNPMTEIGKKLKTDRDDFSAEAGLKLGGTKVYVGGEYSSKHGDESLFWGGRLVDIGNNVLLWLDPLSRRVDYNTNRVYAGVNQEVAGFDLSLRHDIEKSYGSSFHSETGYALATGVKTHDRLYIANVDHITQNTSLGFEGDIIENKLNLDARYRFTRTDNWNNVDSDAFDGVTRARQYDEHSVNLVPSDHAGQSYSHAGNVTLSWTGWDSVAPYMSFEVESGKSKNASVRREDGSIGGAGDGNDSTADEIWDFRTRNYENNVRGVVGATISAIPKTKVTVQFDVERSKVSQWWVADFQTQTGGDPRGDWSWDADVVYTKRIYALSARTRPFGWLSGGAKYRFTDQTTAVDNKWRYIENKGAGADPEYSWPVGAPRTELYYPGRIGGWSKPTQEFNLNASIAPCPYFTLRPRFDFVSSSYNVDGEQFKRIATYQTSVWGLSADVLTPIEGLTATVGVSRRTGLTETLAADMSNSVVRNPMSGAAATNYFGAKIGGFSQDAVTLDAQGNYVVKSWVFNVNGGRTDAQGNYPTRLWWTGAGVEYKVTQDVSARVKGSFYDYSERFNGAINDYRAKIVAMALTARFAR
ncbi:MAG: hypothetical protein HY927_14885 [Elusimicrobia bacterium]|nr:hypothetical protein [Elusimicrobiota bacterium]